MPNNHIMAQCFIFSTFFGRLQPILILTRIEKKLKLKIRFEKMDVRSFFSGTKVTRVVERRRRPTGTVEALEAKKQEKKFFDNFTDNKKK